MKTTHLHHIGKMIRQMREYRQMSQLELANAIGIDQAEVSHIEAGKRNMTINTIVKISQALNCSIDIRLTPL